MYAAKLAVPVQTLAGADHESMLSRPRQLADQVSKHLKLLEASTLC
jgi:hypothetical protein